MKNTCKSRSRSNNSEKGNEVLASLGRVLTVPSPRSKWADTTIQKDFFWRDAEKRDKCAYPPPDGVLRYIRQEPRVQDRRDIDESSVLRFRNERKELPLSECHFSYPKPTTIGWQAWVHHIIYNPNYKDALESVGISYALLIYSNMIFRLPDNDILRDILSRWSTQTHTFVTAWGELTPTLEDVCALLAFPVSGLTDIKTVEISEEDEEIIESLLIDMKKSKNARGQASFFTWIRYFFGNAKSKIRGPHFGCQYELEAFLACWLSLYVFPGGPEKGVSPRFFHLAVRMARGERFALAPFYLGSLYWRLDLFHEASVRSKGRYTVVSDVDLGFLQLFFSERYKRYPGMPTDKPKSLEPRASTWVNRKPLGQLLDVIDNEKEVEFRPYTKEIDGYAWCPEDYPSGSSGLVNLFECGEQLSDAEAMYVIWCTPGGLPGLHDWCDSSDSSGWFLKCRVMVYSPHRVARQFGYDQGVPPVVAIDMNFDACCEASSLEKRNDIYTMVRQMFFPSISRSGVASPGWLTYWTSCLDAFKQYRISGTDDNLRESTIYKYEFHYELPKEDKSSAPSTTADLHMGLPVPEVRQIKRPRIHEGVRTKNTSATSAEQASNNNTVARSTAITQPFPHRYGRGKELRIKAQIENPVITIEGKEDVEQSDHELTPEDDANPHIDIDDDPKTFETVPMNEENPGNEADGIGHDQVRSFEELERMINHDDHEVTLLEENRIQAYGDALVESASHRTMPVDDSLAAVSDATVATSATPPPANRVAQHDGVEDRAENTMTTTTDATSARVSDGIISFHGYNVPLHLLPSLERLHAMEGDFWIGSVCLGTAVTIDVMTLLGRAVELLDRQWYTLQTNELELLISSVAAASAFRFRISKMERIAAEARKILDCKDLMDRYEKLKAEYEQANAALRDSLGDTDMASTVKSVVDA